MSRKRMIDPGIWTDPEVLRLSSEAFIVFVGLISHADDEGIIETDPDGLYFKLARREISPEKIVECLGILEKASLTKRYSDYAFLPNWYKHQSLDRPTETKLLRPPREIVDRYPGYVAGWEKAFSTKDKPRSYPFETCSGMPQGELDGTSTDTRGESEETSTDARGDTDEDSTSCRRGLDANGRERKGREEKRKESARVREEDFDVPDSPGGRIAVTWYRRFTKETARLVEPSAKDRKAAVEVCSRLDPDAVQRAIETYFTTDLWFNTDKTTKQRRYSFQSFLANITELLSPNARASPEIELTPHCEACGKLLINGECMNLECAEYRPVEYEELQL